MDCLRTAWCWCAALVLATLAAAGPRYSSRIVHTHAGAIRGIIVEPASRRLEPVEVFLGVPYAGAPARLAPPPPAPSWPGTRLADAFAPVCPQRYPDISNKSAALAKMPLGIYNELRATVPLLANQSEDCLYLNIYVPGSGARGVEAPYAVVVWAGGPSHEWGTANALDGAVLAARAHLLVVTINYRLGLLGYLTPGVRSTAVQAAGGAAVLDVAAALGWVRRNVASFGGDPRRVTLAGHAAGAALVNALLMLPDSKGLVSRVLLLSGSALSPAALAPDAALAREHTAQALRCTPETTNDENWFVECIRARPLAALLAVEAPRARFLAGWAPSVPVSRDVGSQGQAPTRALHASETFLDCALAVVVATTESYQFFNEEDIRHGFEEEHRNRILRTYVRNVYRYHRNEIFAAIRNEYTDWEKPIQHPINIRDATLESLSDAAVTAPALRVAQLHARRGARTYFAHFAHQSKDADYPQRLGSVTSETLAYFLGLPLVGGMQLAPRNYSRGDVAVAETAVSLLAAFAKTGDPTPRAEDRHHDGATTWPRYEMNTQQYLSIGTKLRVKSHYRGHKMALWLHLIPQLHRPGAAPRHHQFRSIHPDMFAGEIFPELYTTTSALDDEEDSTEPEEDSSEVEECEPSPSPRPALSALPAPQPSPKEDSLTNLDSQYYSYTVALGVTVGAGCFLLALNVLVFAGIYLQRGRRRTAHRRPRREGSCSSRSGASLSNEPTSVTSPRKSTLKQRVRTQREAEQRRRRAAKKTRPDPRDIGVDDF
ncbi:neuroligin-4, X-linked-like isoform X1 [Spodoptera litura]|uniref:Neuroligin-4, X-linked-like isoform X1 n=1 Tax=Spodoptera litura TaxID=69820 RepID=A0A9J7E3I0_SPOLT|nr:neuroligin-4, X-linked-like isoform X1 [Spodoptera litura]